MSMFLFSGSDDWDSSPREFQQDKVIAVLEENDGYKEISTDGDSEFRNGDILVIGKSQYFIRALKTFYGSNKKEITISPIEMCRCCIKPVNLGELVYKLAPNSAQIDP